jgi:hypothetical protein
LHRLNYLLEAHTPIFMLQAGRGNIVLTLPGMTADDIGVVKIYDNIV